LLNESHVYMWEHGSELLFSIIFFNGKTQFVHPSTECKARMDGWDSALGISHSESNRLFYCNHGFNAVSPPYSPPGSRDSMELENVFLREMNQRNAVKVTFLYFYWQKIFTIKFFRGRILVTKIILGKLLCRKV
jgi:hypothetical protein